MRKKRENRKGEGTAERFPPSKIILMKEMSLRAYLGEFYSKTPFINYQNILANTITMGEKRKKTKREQNGQSFKKQER